MATVRPRSWLRVELWDVDQAGQPQHSLLSGTQRASPLLSVAHGQQPAVRPTVQRFAHASRQPRPPVPCSALQHSSGGSASHLGSRGLRIMQVLLLSAPHEHGCSVRSELSWQTAHQRQRARAASRWEPGSQRTHKPFHASLQASFNSTGQVQVSPSSAVTDAAAIVQQLPYQDVQLPASSAAPAPAGGDAQWLVTVQNEPPTMQTLHYLLR